MRPYYRLFIRGLAFGLVAGLCLGFLVAWVHCRIGCLSSIIPFDLLVGGFFGLVGGWCLALHSVVEHMVKDLLGVVAVVVPWVGRAAAPVWLSRVNAVFGDIFQRSTGALRFMLDRWIRNKFRVAGPFLEAVDREEKKRRPLGSMATPSSLAFAALQVLLLPIHRAFWIAYLLLLAGACLFWTLPFLLRTAS